jgi:hypothetical protein
VQIRPNLSADCFSLKDSAPHIAASRCLSLEFPIYKWQNCLWRNLFASTHSAHDESNVKEVTQLRQDLSPMFLKQKSSTALLATFALALSVLSVQPSESRSVGHLSSGGGHVSGGSSHGSSAGHSSHATSMHFFGGRGYHRYHPYGGYYSDQQSLPPVSNQFDQYTMAQDARRVALPTSAFVHEYHWASSPAPEPLAAQQSVLRP